MLYNTVGNNPQFQHTIPQQDREVQLLQHQIPLVLDSIDALVDHEGPLPYTFHTHTPAYSTGDVPRN